MGAAALDLYPATTLFPTRMLSKTHHRASTLYILVPRDSQWHSVSDSANQSKGQKNASRAIKSYTHASQLHHLTSGFSTGLNYSHGSSSLVCVQRRGWGLDLTLRACPTLIHKHTLGGKDRCGSTQSDWQGSRDPPPAQAPQMAHRDCLLILPHLLSSA